MAETTFIIDKFRKGDKLLLFINDSVNDFIKSTNDLEYAYIIPPNLLEEKNLSF